MRVGVLTFACDAGRSGIGQYVIHLLRALPEAAPEIEFEIVGREDELPVFLPDSNPYPTHAARSTWRHPALNILWQNLMLPRLCQARGFDAVFLPAANRRLPVWLPCPSVGTVHDFSSLHIAGKYDPLRDVYIKRILPALMRRLTRVISVSECTKQDIVDYAHIPAERISVIHHGVNHDVYFPGDRHAAQQEVCGKYGIEPPYVLYVSRIEHPGKNHVRLIRAFAELKATAELPHQLVLAGSDWNRAEEAHRAAHESGLGDAVLFTGFIDGVDLPNLYRGADLFVFPSLFEGFGMPILEAMACGAPVACSDVSSLPEVAQDGACYFPPTDEDAMAASLKTMLLEAEVRDGYVERGLAIAAAATWSNAAAATVDALRAAVR